MSVLSVKVWPAEKMTGSVFNVLHVTTSILSRVGNISVIPLYPSIHSSIHLFSVAIYLALKVTEVAPACPSCHVAKDGAHFRLPAGLLHSNVWVPGTWEASQRKHTGTGRKLRSKLGPPGRGGDASGLLPTAVYLERGRFKLVWTSTCVDYTNSKQIFSVSLSNPETYF